jgi:AcrR family transcriptional regulator
VGSIAGARLGRPRTVQDEDVFLAMAELVLRIGLPRLSVNELADGLGVTPAALRQRFGSKAQLVHAFHDWSTSQMRTGLDAAERGGGSPLEVLDAIARTSVPSIDSPQRMINALSMLTDPAADDIAREQIARRLAISREYLARLLARAMAAGELVHSDPDVVADRLQAALIGACVLWALRPDAPGGLADRIRSATDTVIAPLRPPTVTRRTLP